MVLRPHFVCRAIGPVLLVVAVGLAGAGLLAALVLVPIAVIFFPTVWARLDVGEHEIRRRRWRGGWTSVSTDSVDTLRLRRLPFPVLAWLKRGHRFGRFWSVPLTVRLQHEENVLVELRCIWWNGWRELARFAAAQPDVDLDLRTRGRLARYVGPLAWATSYDA
jgi:hypothetical protein